MSSFSVVSILPEEHFQCSICLDVFSDPVTTSCGHNFCKACIGGHWDNSDICQCPKCNKRFYTRPEVSTNAVMEEISVQIKRRKLDAPECFAAAGEVACDVCTGSQLKALKSCLMCLTSYCEAHLEPHQRVATLKRHKLIDPVENLEDRMCKKHERPLELFCRDEEMCVCVLCTETDHKWHDTVLIEDEGQRQKGDLGSIKAKIQKMIQFRQKKMEQIQLSTDVSKASPVNADKEVEDSGKLFSALLLSFEQSQADLHKMIEERQRAVERCAEGFIKRLEQEITELQRRSTELEQLSHTEDHLHFLQSLPTLAARPSTKDWSQVRVHSDHCVGTVRRAVSRLEEKVKREVKAFTEIELKRIQKYKVDITMDNHTASCWLKVSDDGTKIKYANTRLNVSDEPERFSEYSAVLGNQSFKSGRHYWEVQVGLSGKWEVGVANETINRKKAIRVDSNHGFFAMSKSGFCEYMALSSPSTTLNLNPKPRRVGVYVDYEKGQVSFYDINEKSHIFSFFGLSFKEKLYPYFYLYSMAKKSESIVILSNKW